ncbi:hypothetical protein ACA910_016826 [Epithemia clementina (nom. ined.)]
MSAAPAATAAEAGVGDNNNPPPPPPPGEAGPGAGEATLLVSEFPPPPFYYRLTPSLTQPSIPRDALERGTRRAAAVAAKARAESERLRLEGESQDAILAGTAATAADAAASANDGDDDGSVVAVFGEIVEDPVLFQPLDRCEDPRVVRDEVKRLNNEAVKGFVELVKDLVHRPMENKKTRDALSHNVFLMLQECNKFREHQARETLIDLLEKQLDARKRLLAEMLEGIMEADALLAQDAS